MSTRRIPERDPTTGPPADIQQTETRLHIPAATLAKVGFATILTLASLWLLTTLSHVIVLIVLALLAAVVLSQLVDWLQNRGVPRGLAAVISVISVLLVLGTVLALVIPPLVKELDQFFDNLPHTAERLRGRLSGEPSIYNAVAGKIESLRRDPTGLLSGALRFGFGVVSNLFTSLLLLTLTLYFLIDGESTRTLVLRLTPAEYRDRVAASLSGVAGVVRAFFIGRSIVSGIFALFTFLLMTALNLPYAAVLSVLAFFLGAIPNIGSALATIVPALVALAYKGFSTAVIVAAALLAYNQIENNWIQPRILSRKLNVSSLATMVAVLLGGKLLGVIGVLLAMPFAGMLPVLERIWFPGNAAAPTPLPPEQRQVRPGPHA